MVFDNNATTLAILSFISTTVDDFCVILIFFAREYVKTRVVSSPQTIAAFVNISIGQILGFTIIVGVSLVLGMALHSVINSEYVDLVGIFPIAIGLYKLVELLYETGVLTLVYSRICCIASINGDKIIDGQQTEGEIAPLIPVKISTFQEDLESATEEDLRAELIEDPEIDIILNKESLESLNAVDQSNSSVVFIKRMCCFMDPLVIEVMIYALMFGTDNIAIYVALFSGVSFLQSIVVCIFFYSLLILYLLTAIIIIVKVCPCTLSVNFVPDILLLVPNKILFTLVRVKYCQIISKTYF